MSTTMRKRFSRTPQITGSKNVFAGNGLARFRVAGTPVPVARVIFDNDFSDIAEKLGSKVFG